MAQSEHPLSTFGSDSRLVAEARAGSKEALARLLSVCRDYLLLVANRELEPQLLGKVSPSDLVQETMFVGYEKFEEFHGDTKEQFLGWLRQTLVNRCVDADRQFRQAQKRRLDAEVALQGGVSSERPETMLPDGNDSPSRVAYVHEREEIVEKALQSLPIEYQQVIRLRAWEGLQFDHIGKRMGRSSEAARKLWFRALEQLGEILRTSHEDLGSISQSR